MKIISLHVVNVKAHSDRTFRFDGKTTMILGQNGTGKSTIVESLYYALFRELLVPNVDCMISNDIKKLNPETGKTTYTAPSYIDLELEHENTRYMIRSALAKTTSFIKKYNPEEGTWGEVANKITEMYSFIQSRILNGMSAEYFINSIYTEQMGILNLVSQTPSIRQNEFDKLIGISRFQDIHEGLTKVFTMANKELDPAVEDTKNKVYEYEKVLERMNAEVKDEEATVAEQRIQYKEAAAKEKKAAAILKEHTSKMEELQEDYSALRMKNQSYIECRDSAASIDKEIEKMKTELESCKDVSAYEEKRATLLESITRRASAMINYVEKKQDGYRKEKARLEHLMSSMKRYRDLEYTMKSDKEQLDKIKTAVEKDEQKLNEMIQRSKFLKDTEDALTVEINAMNVKSAELDFKRVAIINAYKDFDLVPFDDIKDFIRNGKPIVLTANEYECPHCHSKVTKAAFMNELNEARKNYDDLCHQLMSLDKDRNIRNEYDRTLNELGLLENKIKNEQDFLTSSKITIARLEQNIASAKVTLDDMSFNGKTESEEELQAAMNDLDKKIAFKLNPELYRFRSEKITEEKKTSSKEIVNDIYELEMIDADLNSKKAQRETLESAIASRTEEAKRLRDRSSEMGQSACAILSKHNVRNEAELGTRLSNMKSVVVTADEAEKTARENVVRIESRGKELAASIQAKLKAMEPYKKFIEEGKEKIEANKKAERKIALLNTAKAYFKHDGLAKIIRKFYIDRINEAMKSYVSLFNFGFLPRIDDTAGIENYNMYSGGQKIAIAILMKLTLNMMLNNPINMMILDEPTPYMDSERIEAIRELVDNIKDRMQVFVITHDTEFMGIECNTINL